MKVGILTISDRSSRGERPDTSGVGLADYITSINWEVTRTAIVADEKNQIQSTLVEWADQESLDLILTTGGTGFSPRDVTPEATLGVIDRLAPGLAEAMRAASLKFTPHAMLSRAIAGIRGKTLIINLPGSPSGALENLQVVVPVLPHAVELLNSSPHAEAGHQLDH